MTISLGILGAGFIANQHADAFGKVGATVRAVCDIDFAKAERFAAKREGVHACRDIDEVLAREDVDAVIVAVPNLLHKEFAVRGLAAGKDVLLEKPMALNAAECDEIIAAHRRTDRMLQLGFVCRQTAAAIAAREFVTAGRLGTIHHAKASLYRRRGIPGLGRWFTTRGESGGGAVIDIGVHLVDLAMHVAGQRNATRVSATCASLFGSPIDQYRFTEMWAGPPNPQGVCDVEDSAHGFVRFENGMSMELNVTWAANLPEGLFKDGVVLLGDRGGVFFDAWGDKLTVVTEEEGYLVDLAATLPSGDAWGAAWERQAKSFCEAVTTRTPPAASGEDGRMVQAVLDAVYRSSAERREVEVSSSS